MNSKAFWIANNLALLGLYAAAATLYLNGRPSEPLVWLVAIILGTHVLEIPYAFKLLGKLNPAPARVIVGTLLFGFTWWLPAKRGIYALR